MIRLPSGHRRLTRGLFVAAVLLATGLLATGLSGIGLHSAGSSRGSGITRADARSASLRHADARRARSVAAVLRARSHAILHHDRSALLATIDPRARDLRASQSRMLTDLRRVPFASWSYAVDGSGSRAVPVGVRERAATTTYAPRSMSLRYRIAGFDSSPTNLVQYPVFTRRSGHWYLDSLTAFDRSHHRSATDLWDYGPVSVVRRPAVLVLGSPGQLATMVGVADALQAALPRVTAVWGRHWSRRVVALVPSTQRELGLITADHGDLHQIAALSSAEVQAVRGAPAPVGGRVSINPAVWPSLGPLGRQVVLTHELTHVASAGVTGVAMPTWVVEGFADYVGFLGAADPVPAIAAELTRDVRAGQLPSRLPTDGDFDGSSRRLPQTYEQAWLACRLIATEAGQRGLVRFYRAVGTSTAAQRPAVGSALERVLHIGLATFTAQWRRYVAAQLR